MTARIIECRDDIMLININGRTQTVLDNPYNRLKYEMFDGNRIFYKFADNIILQETFDNGIFNCTIDTDTMQLRCANQIAEAIKAHKESGSYARFKKIFSFAYTAKYQEKIVDEFLEYYMQTRRIEKVDIITTTNRKVVKGYQIDNRFAVDEHNQAYFWDEVNTEKDQQYKFKHGWNQLCIVTKGQIPPQITIDSPIGKVLIEGKAIEVISKIFFLLNPNIEDDTFMEQLPKDLQEQLKRDVPKTNNDNKRTTKDTD